MIVVEYSSIEMDYCTGCRGVWFDSGELELLLEMLSLQDAGVSLESVLKLPKAASSENHRRCPVCRSKMTKADLVKEPEVLVDICPRGEGIWFDGGEVSQFARKLCEEPCAKPDSREKVLGFLAEAFRAEQ